MGGPAVIIPANLAARILRPADTDMSDLTAAARDGDAGWLEDGSLSIPFSPEPTPAEQSRILRRLLTASPADEAVVAALVDAYADLADRTTPTATAVRLLIQDRLGPLFMEA